MGEETGSDGPGVFVHTHVSCALCQAGGSRWEVNAVRLGKGVKKWGLMASLSVVVSGGVTELPPESRSLASLPELLCFTNAFTYQ